MNVKIKALIQNSLEKNSDKCRIVSQKKVQNKKYLNMIEIYTFKKMIHKILAQITLV